MLGFGRYNLAVSNSRSAVDANRIVVLVATVLLSYALTRLVQAPQFTLEFQFPGFYFSYPLSVRIIMVLLTAGLTATGMDWLIQSHPYFEGGPTVEYWLLPTLATFIIGLPLTILSLGLAWWISFVIGGLLLLLIFQAEFIAVDPSSPNYAIATSGLTALSYAVFLILATALRFNGVRLFLLAPILWSVSGLVAIRNLKLVLGGDWKITWAIGTGFICMQIGVGLHYWPVSPLQYGLVLFGVLYAMISLASSLLENIQLSRAVIEPTIILGISCGIAIVLP